MGFKSIMAVAVAACVAVPANATLLLNGSFEVQDGPRPANWTRLQVGGATGFVDSSMTQAVDGVWSARFRTSASNFQGLSQTVSTVAGNRYLLTYSMLNEGLTALDEVIVTSGPVVTVFGDRAPFAWTTFSQSFFANSDTTTISFLVKHTGVFFTQFMYLDNVSLVDFVPEPESWAMLIAGFGIVGAAARRRRSGRSVIA